MSNTFLIPVEISKQREMVMYSELWHAGNCVLEQARINQEGASWQFLSAVLLTAFAFEAYQNHVGPSLFAHWSHLDRLPPLAKLDLIIDRLEIKLPNAKSGRPWQSIRDLFDFRNTIAHGRSKQLDHTEIKNTTNYHDALNGELLDDWELRIKDDKFVLRCRQDVETVLRLIHEELPEPKEALFTFGMGLNGVTVLDDLICPRQSEQQ
ncbi:hypothetical protein B0T40_12615 [Chromobacterium haemolyticum]|uniref:hypothetical protein n=1 Tax=Chromobacterium haemolyticum TaxID=394935 RepID=UPI0009DB1821|nr:hypothetical protein [Chromobacterium haemolyticum]OQS35579.1 hypothetical protein B0T40_12615 [Chromobacterium haemolyticum]